MSSLKYTHIKMGKQIELYLYNGTLQWNRTYWKRKVEIESPLSGFTTGLEMEKITKRSTAKCSWENIVYFDRGYNIVYSKIQEKFNWSQTQHFRSTVELRLWGNSGCEVSVHGQWAQGFRLGVQQLTIIRVRYSHHRDQRQEGAYVPLKVCVLSSFQIHPTFNSTNLGTKILIHELWGTSWNQTTMM